MSEQPIFGITNIPQDIKLELNNGTLTLKAGSKVYVPNGSGVFDAVTVSVDATRTQSSGGTSLCFFYNNTIYAGTITACYSGSTAPTPTTNTAYWYDTTNNSVKRTGNGGSTWTGGFSLPFVVMSVSGGAISSIDQVFNGFGYIGSSYFVLPGVEGFYPNGKDGFKNVFKTIKLNQISVYTIVNRYTNLPVAFSTTFSTLWAGFEVVDKVPPVQDMIKFRRYYSKFDNKVFETTDNINLLTISQIPFGYISTESLSPYKISSFTIVNPFATITPHIVSDYSKYLANLLIIQYNNKPKAKATIESVGAMFPDELILSVRDGFNIDTATGKQLDILAKYIGASRGYTDGNNQKAVLTDEEFRVLLKLKIIVNNGTGTLYGLETSLYNLFGTGIRVVETKDGGGNPNMGLTYYIRSDWANIGLAAVQQNILPHPTGVGYTYNLAALTKYFGFIEYTDLSHPFTTGFRDYSDPTKAGEMYAYDKVIQQ